MLGGRADCGWICKQKSKSGRLWGPGKTVKRKINSVRAKRTANSSTEKGANLADHCVPGEGNAVDESCHSGKRTADGSKGKRATIRGVAT